MQPEELEPFLHHLCELAAVETIPRFRSLEGIENKAHGAFDPVTEADKAAEIAIRDAIISTYPDHGILGEEFGTLNPDSEFQWVIDPVDGTRSFISGIPLWGTLIGLYRQKKPWLGIMSQPFIGEKYWTVRSGSWYEKNGVRKKLSTGKISELSEAILLTTTPALFSGEERLAYERLENNIKLPRYGTDCYAYCLLASGNVDLVVESGLHIYDIAALIPIIEQAGGIVTNWQGGPCYEGGQILAAATEELHHAAMEVLSG